MLRRQKTLVEQKKQTQTRKKRSKSFNEGDPILASYLSDIADSSPLSSGEEAELARRIRSGDEEARNELVEANLRFVVSVAKDYQNRGLSLAELISAGNVGLIIAAERFDETKGYKFISYAVWWIRQSILQTLMEQSTVRMPVNRIDMMAKISRTYEELQQDGAPPTLEKVASTLGFTEEKIEQTMINSQPIRSLDATFDEGEERCLLDYLCDEDQLTPEERVLEDTLQEDINSVLSGLNAREAEVLRLYFGLGQERSMTLDQIGTRFKLTRERVRQIKEIALSKLRHPRFYTRLRGHAEV
jgi:RNA polymerase primary sigma factor